MQIIKVDGVAGAEQEGEASRSGFQFNLLSALPFIALSILVAGLAGMAYFLHTPRLYRAQATVWVEQEDDKVLKIERVESDDLKSEESLKTIEQSLTSPELLLGMVNHNNLQKDPGFLTELKRPLTDNVILGALSGHITATIRGGTRLIDLTVQDRSPVMAQKMANLLIGEYIQADRDKHVEATERANSFLLQQAAELKAQLAKSDAALHAYREQNQGIPLDESQNTILAKLAKLSELATEAKTTRLQLEADYTQVKKLQNGSPTDLLVIPKVADAPGLVDLQKSVADKKVEMARLATLYRKKNPVYVAVASQLQELQTAVDRAILTAANQVINEYDSAAAMEERMEGALHEQEQIALELDKKHIQYNILQREVDSDRVLWESVLGRLKETDVAKGVQQDAIRVLSHPFLPEKPIWPDKLKILLISAFAGLALGCGLYLLAESGQRTFKTIDSAEAYLGMPAIGLIPKVPKRKLSGRGMALLKRRDSALAESFRSLRTSLSLLGESQDWKTFLFTSANPREGKSFCAVHCAAAFALGGLRTLLIDADMRFPCLDSIFFADPADLGLSDYLTQRTDLDNVVRASKVNNLSVLCAGKRLGSPTELLSGNGFGHLLKDAVSKFDRVVIDSAPVVAVSDTLLLARQIPATCLVISAQTSPKAVLDAIRKLAGAGSTLAGFILNRAKPQKIAKAYRRYYQAGYGGNTADSPAGARWPHFPEPAALRWLSAAASGKMKK